MPKQFERGAKVQHAKEALKQLGPDCNYQQFKAHIEKKHGYTPPDSTFYNQKSLYRKELETMANNQPAKPAEQAKPANGGGKELDLTKETQPAMDMSGILELVDAGQLLIKKLGREQAQQFIGKLSG